MTTEATTTLAAMTAANTTSGTKGGTTEATPTLTATTAAGTTAAGNGWAVTVVAATTPAGVTSLRRKNADKDAKEQRTTAGSTGCTTVGTTGGTTAGVTTTGTTITAAGIVCGDSSW